jgi:hypothetical protein
MCEEQQTKIAALIVEAIWRHANKLVEHRPKNLDHDAMLLWMRNREEAGQSITFSEVSASRIVTMP